MRNKKELALHVLFWVFNTLIFTFIEGAYSEEFRRGFYLELGFLPGRLVVVYINYSWLLPKYLLQSNYPKYISYTLISLLLGSLIHRVVMYAYVEVAVLGFEEPSQFWGLVNFVQGGIIILIPFMFLIGLTVLTKWKSAEQKAESFEKEKLAAELNYLRSQINPHFFFNTLNSLYGLALNKSEKTPEVVLRLSELMSYILYEADKAAVTVSKELEQIESYVALEQIRFGNRFEVDIQVEGDTDFIKIPPLILLPFVENAFKHGVNTASKDGWLSIKVSCDNEILDFEVRNKVFELDRETSENKGLGIKNVSKRLDLLFPEKHELSCQHVGQEYHVRLLLKETL
ncbi:sensor histidine kinase [Roseivirga sp. 4D4]|uniref:sensor histidine kinase n=1 Tax=Roseivirga sp. 4D4 TaxID=1889784 RepID=UPI0021017F5D|nr:histidine kinase [Roseivirga sp. 4D4]